MLSSKLLSASQVQRRVYNLAESLGLYRLTTVNTVPLKHLSNPTISRHSFAAANKRQFSASMSTKQEWLVVIPDFEGAIEQRIAIRDKHLENVKPVVQSGRVITGGATLAEPLKAGERPKMTGSVLIAQADTEEDVRQLLKEDVYVEAGVWNLDAVKITPIKIAVRKGLPDLNI